MSSLARYELFEHQADMGVRGFGSTCAEAFEQAALALTFVVVPPESVRSVEAVRIHRESPDRELLLLDWLSTVVYEMATRRMVFGRFEVVIVEASAGATLDAALWGETLDLERHQPGVEVKAATATSLRVTEADDGTWLAQCVVDV